jgi:transposase
MRAKPAEREQAIALRQQGLSYAEIQSRVSVSQSSLSLWLRHVSLSAAQKERLA